MDDDERNRIEKRVTLDVNYENRLKAVEKKIDRSAAVMWGTAIWLATQIVEYLKAGLLK